VTTAPVGAEIRPSTGQRQVIIAALLFAAALVLCGEALSASAAPPRAVVWGALALACYAFGLVCLAQAAESAGFGFTAWKFGPWVLLWYGLAYGLATVTWNGTQISVAREIAVPSVLRALWLVAVGITFWTVGYFVGPGRPIRRLAARGMTAMGRLLSGTVRSRLSPWLLYAIGTAARFASTATTGRFGYAGNPSTALTAATGYGQILSGLSLLAPLAIAAAALQVYREQIHAARITLVILFMTELAFGAAAGGKGSFVIAVLAVVIPMCAARHRLPKAMVIGAILAFLAIVLPFNQAYRSAVRGGPTILSPSEALQKAPLILSQTFTGHSLMTVLPDSVTYLLQRMREIDNPAIILQRTPGQIAFSSPGQLILAPLGGIVPRAVWAGKPILATGYEFSQQYYDIPSTIYTSSAITPVGDLYRHGGWIPVIAGMFLLGCWVRLLDDTLDIRANPHSIFLILLLFPTLVTSEEDWVSFVAGIPANILIWLLAVALTFRYRRSA